MMENTIKLIRTRMRRLFVISIIAITGFMYIACSNPQGGTPNISITFSSLSANGSETQTTTQLTLTFSQVIAGLSATDITLSGVSGVSKGTLSGSGPTYTLPINNVTASGTLTVSVTKSGISMSGSPRNVPIYYYAATPTVTFSGLTANGSPTQTSTQLTLTFSQAITGLTANDITLSGVSGINIGTLSGSGPTYTLAINNVTASGTLTVEVAKTGINISGSSRTVPIYYYVVTPTVTFSGLTANGSAIQTTTQLTLTFSQAITGLTANDISLSGVSGVSNGILSGSGPSYTLTIDNVTVSGTLTVTVAKTGITINSSPKTVPIYYYAVTPTVTFSGLSADGSTTQTTTQLTLTFSQAIAGLSADDITLSGVPGLIKGTLSGSGPAYTLTINNVIASGTLTVAVAKSGINITSSPKTVPIYFYTVPSTGIVINLTGMDEWELTEQTAQAGVNLNKTFTVNGAYASYKWYLDGVVVGTSSSYLFNSSVKDVYQLVVVVTDSGGESRSGSCRITVANNPPEINENIWINGNLPTVNSEDWYSFPVTSGTTYRIWWNGSLYGDGTKKGNIVVSAKYANSSTWIFGGTSTSVLSGWTSPQSFTANQTGMVYVRVIPYLLSNSYIGTYGIVWSTGSARPAFQ